MHVSLVVVPQGFPTPSGYKIKHKTRYGIDYSTADLIDKAAKAVREMPVIEPPKILTKKASIGIGEHGFEPTVLMVREEEAAWGWACVPDCLAYLQRETSLTRTTLASILRQSGRLGDVAVNPQHFLDEAVKAIHRTLQKLMIEGIQYELLKGEGAVYPVGDFPREFESYEQRLIEVEKSIYEAIEFDSEIEREFARRLDTRTDIRLFVKLSGWFKVPTPVGNYNPDWAIVLQRDETVYLVRETKGTTDLDKLRPDEAGKIRCGKVHFKLLAMDFAVVTSADEIR